MRSTPTEEAPDAATVPKRVSAPRISVLLSTYANRRFIPKKLAEIRAQTCFAECEFLFIETGSPERERELLEPFCREHPNCRLITTPDRKPLYAAWNLGWSKARAPLLCYSNMDDTMHPDLLRQVVSKMERNGWDACSVLIAMQDEGDPGRDTWDPRRLRHLKLSRRPGPFTAWRTDLAARIGRFDEGFFGAGDLDFWARITNERLHIGLIRQVLYLFTHSSDQLSKSALHAERRQQDKARLAAKPYPVRWPPAIWREVLLWRGLARLAPGLLLKSSP